jgi:hypothetical protein
LGHYAKFALRAEQNDWLICECAAGRGSPEGHTAASAVLAEHPEVVAVEPGVPGPPPQPVAGVLGGEELVVGLAVDAVAIGVVEGDSGHGGERAWERAIVGGAHGRSLGETSTPPTTASVIAGAGEDSSRDPLERGHAEFCGAGPAAECGVDLGDLVRPPGCVWDW